MTTTERKKLLIVISKSPFDGQAGKEALDAVLTAAAFEQPLSMLFIGDGVYQLLSGQNAKAIEAKNIAATLPVLPMYDVENIYADAQALSQRGIAAADCLLAVESLELEAVQQLFQSHQAVLSF